ncbi:MAG TPA: PIN domain-containing protein [Terriglobales bacterium]|nr:PIN domain-containing protein [Terriglobales bacterium]
MLNLDTHILLHAAAGELTSAESAALSRDPRWCISGIVLWEIEKLHAAGRIRAGLDDPSLAKFLDAVEVWPIDVQVCLHLRQLDFRGDPADEIIAATSLAHRVALVTRDHRLRASRVLRCL